VLRVAYLARGFAGHAQETEIKPGPRKLMLKIDRGWYTPHATLLGCYVCRATTVPHQHTPPLAAAAWWGRMFSRRFSLALHTRGCHTAPLPGSHLTCLSSRTVSCPVICRRCTRAGEAAAPWQKLGYLNDSWCPYLIWRWWAHKSEEQEALRGGSSRRSCSGSRGLKEVGESVELIHRSREDPPFLASVACLCCESVS